MKLIKEIDKLYEKGTLQTLVKSGMMPSNVLAWRALYHSYLFELEQTKSKMQAMQNVATNFNVSVGLIEKIRRKFD